MIDRRGPSVPGMPWMAPAALPLGPTGPSTILADPYLALVTRVPDATHLRRATRHTDSVRAILNSLQRQGILAQVAVEGRPEWTLNTAMVPDSYTDEQAQDAAAALFTNSATVTWVYDDVLATLTATAAGSTGTLFDYSTDAGNSGTLETTIFTATIAANTLGPLVKIHAFYSIKVAIGAGITSQIKVKFAGTTIFDSTALALAALPVGSDGTWTLDLEMVVCAITTWRFTTLMITPGATVNQALQEIDTGPFDYTIDNVLEVTVQRAGFGSADNQILGKHGFGERIGAA